MPDENYLEKMLNQLAELFKIVEEAKGKPVAERVTPEIQERLDRAKELVEKFAELNKKAFESAGLKEENLNQLVKFPAASLPAKNKKLLDFAKKLKADVENAKTQLSTESASDGLMYSKDKQKVEEIQKRKKKFKRIGKNWL